jgi:hypothetical protein
MTNREFFTAITNGTITEEVVAHATAALAKLDATNEARKNKVSPKEAEKQAADAVIREQIFALLTADPQIAADLGAAAGVTTNKASAELRKLVAEGRVIKTDIKVPMRGTVKGYSLPAVNVDATDAE